MRLDDFNAASATDAVKLLRPCLDIPRWIDEIVRARPFGSLSALTSFAAAAAPDLSEDELDGALAHHPRIGERPAGESTEAGLSRQEQSGLDGAGDTADRIAAGNRAYEEKFGRVFLIRAAGRSAEDILANLQERLGHTREEELPVVAGQLREIALLRLKGTVTP
ncbi:2-oxo-4-hydroxy-4-carboxy-5-ureidoimidazoline decarboxylase [Arthrobacter crusticola]|uniref:2-oxo-4-hydroxy-4-carboxy-5-ureidoimidazoline decarboxylase n=2 Tax=Arthrobacter crusticola TaxID=2547960 RepID=A0A4R5U0H5_9MICC|nr:2-oxo-4-hydroxy-4-carboxy-5-ureidoimidazoline decarboxylase [Arthrobacter crusticola]TDK27038.1 2-oxo-4-hydroxy-4-carboxy-5-ureidoimidazoline decarboxylase [Arthrobacter crusticola]